MSEPFRLRVTKAASAALEEINPDNGYMHDLRGRVFRGRDVFGDSDPIPMVSILEAIEEKERLQAPSAGTEAAGPWELLIQGFLDDDLIHPTDPAYFLIDRKSTRLNSSHVAISYAVFCLKNKTKTEHIMSISV